MAPDGGLTGVPAGAAVSGDPLEDWPDRTPLRDESGAVVLVFSAAESTRDSIPWADGAWVPPSVPVTHAVALSLRAMPGWRLSTSDPALADAMLAAGATERRHAHTMTTPLRDPPEPGEPAAVRVEPLSPAQADRHATRLGTLNHRAYPRDHPDAYDGDEEAAVSQIRAIARGELLGAMLAESRVALVGGRIAGACLVVDRPGTPPHGGPWVIDIFRDPDVGVPGVGTALLATVLQAAGDAGLPGLSLAVSHANERARRLYQQLGLVSVDESWTLTLPERGGKRRTPALG